MTHKLKYPQLTAFCQAKGYERFELKTIMFDMDGVLFNSMPNHARAWHRAMAFYGLDLPEDEAYMHEGRTGFNTINIVTQRQLGRNADQTECNVGQGIREEQSRPRKGKP